MDRRKVLGVFGAGVAGLAVEPGAARADEERVQRNTLALTIEAAAVACDEVAANCIERLRTGEDKRDFYARSLQLALDCQAFCRTAGGVAARNGALLKTAYRACAEACEEMARQCDQEKSDIMHPYAAVLHTCEEACWLAVKKLGKP